MQEAGNDFLAGTGLPEQQHGGVGRGDLRGLCQYLPPLPRLADDTAISGAGVQLLGQRPHARFELRGTLGGLVRPPGSRDFAIARQRHRQAIGNAAGDQDVGLAEG
jgi:hypothetical protein